MPILILDDGEVPIYVAGFLRNMLLQGAKQPTLAKATKAIGLLYDFYALEKNRPHLDERGIMLLTQQFYEARRYGCEGLGWRPVSLKTAIDDLSHVSRFSSYCQVTYGHLEANPLELLLVSSLSGRDYNAWVSRAVARKDFDLLYHVYGATEEGRGIVRQRAFIPDRGERGLCRTAKSAKFFPPDRVLEFIGKTVGLRDILCWLLMFYGGLRISELLHLYTRDITLEKRTGMARVVLAHPREAKFEWTGRDGQKRRGNRADFLQERYSRIPRHDYGAKHPERSGWKGMKFEDHANRECELYWSDPRMGQLFWKLHTEYLRRIRLRVPDNHPYYFVASKDDAFGAPLKLDNLREQFYAAAERIGLSRSQDGVNPHGARHFYGYFCATWLRLPKDKVQLLMHHRSILSTEIYFTLDPKIVRDELSAAHERMLSAVPTFLRSIELAAIEGSAIHG